MTTPRYWDPTSSSWKAIGIGPAGPIGPQGSIGPQGPQGAPGASSLNYSWALLSGNVSCPVNTTTTLPGLNQSLSAGHVYFITFTLCVSGTTNGFIDFGPFVTPGGYIGGTTKFCNFNNGVVETMSLSLLYSAPSNVTLCGALYPTGAAVTAKNTSYTLGMGGATALIAIQLS